LTKKMATMFFLDPTYVLNRCVTLFVLGFMYSIVGESTRNREQKDVQTLFYYLMFIGGNITFLTIPTFFTYVDRWPTLEREIKGGMYGPLMYWLVTSLINLIICTLAVPFTMVFAYVINDLPGSSFCPNWALLALSYFFYDALAETCSFSGRGLGLFQVAFVLFQSNFNAGAYLNVESIIWPFRLFTYITPLRLLLSSMLALAFQGHEWHGAVRLSDASQEILDSAEGQAALAAGQQFVCPGKSNVCYADNGPDVLWALHDTFSVADPDVRWELHLGWILLQAVVLRLIGALRILLYFRSFYTTSKDAPVVVKGAPAATESSALLAGQGGWSAA